LNKRSAGVFHKAGCICLLSINSFSADCSQFHFTPSAEVLSFLNTDSARVAVGLEDQMFLLKYQLSQTQPECTELTQAQGGILQHISEDGKYMVYARGPRGDLVNNLNEESSAFLTELQSGSDEVLIEENNAFEPRFVRGSDTYQVSYASLGVWGGWEQGETFYKVFDSSTDVFGPAEFLTNGSFYGGANQHVIVSGGSRGVMAPLYVDRVDTVFAFPLYHGGDVNDPEVNLNERQFCNASVSPSALYPKALMGLDFGSAGGLSNPDIAQGTPWGIHEVIFIVDDEKRILKSIKRPASDSIPGLVTSDGSLNNTVNWDDLEWTNHPYYAVTALNVSRSYPLDGAWNTRELQERVFAVNLKNESILELFAAAERGNEYAVHFKSPYLWIDIPDSFEEEHGWLGEVQDLSPVEEIGKSKGLFSIENGKIFLAEGRCSVAIYSLRGELLVSEQFQNPISFSIKERYLLNAGFYSVIVESINQSRKEMIPLF
jgi:hypothetical protein